VRKKMPRYSQRFSQLRKHKMSKHKKKVQICLERARSEHSARDGISWKLSKKSATEPRQARVGREKGGLATKGKKANVATSA